MFGVRYVLNFLIDTYFIVYMLFFPMLLCYKLAGDVQSYDLAKPHHSYFSVYLSLFVFCDGNK